MILQYKGYNENWVFVEAENITWCVCNVRNIINTYEVKYGLSRCYDELKAFLITETHCSDNISFILNEHMLHELDNIHVITLHDSSKYITYVLVDGGYLLNENGKTIMKFPSTFNKGGKEKED